MVKESRNQSFFVVISFREALAGLWNSDVSIFHASAAYYFSKQSTFFAAKLMEVANIIKTFDISISVGHLTRKTRIFCHSCDPSRDWKSL